MRFRSYRKAALLAALSVAALVASATATRASAQGGYTFWPAHSSYTNSPSGWTNIRSCGNTSSRCYIIRSVPNDTSIYMRCWINDGWAYGWHWTNRWFYVTLPGHAWGGYVHASLVRNQARVPHCG